MEKEKCNVRIKRALGLRGMKQSDLCETTKIPKSAMSQYVNGVFEPKQDRIYLIAKALNVSEAWLMGYDVPMGQEENKTQQFKHPSNMFSIDTNVSGVALTPDEANIVIKFRKLDERGKKAVCDTLEREHSYIADQQPHMPNMKNIKKEAEQMKQAVDTLAQLKK